MLLAPKTSTQTRHVVCTQSIIIMLYVPNTLTQARIVHRSSQLCQLHQTYQHARTHAHTHTHTHTHTQRYLACTKIIIIMLLAQTHKPRQGWYIDHHIVSAALSVSWYSGPSQPQRITSGLKKNKKTSICLLVNLRTSYQTTNAQKSTKSVLTQIYTKHTQTPKKN